MKRDYKELLKAGNKAQLEKLLENEHKNGFNSIHPDYATRRIKVELDELEEVMIAINICERHDVPTNSIIELVKDYRSEFGDIANFAHMGILACDKILEEAGASEKE